MYLPRINAIIIKQTTFTWLMPLLDEIRLASLRRCSLPAVLSIFSLSGFLDFLFQLVCTQPSIKAKKHNPWQERTAWSAKGF